MWLWQPKNTHRVLFWRKLFLFSSALHVIALFLIFFVYTGGNFVYNVDINRSILQSGAPIVFLPLRKVVGAQLNTLPVAGGKKSLSVSSLPGLQKYSATTLANLDKKNNVAAQRNARLKAQKAKEEARKKLEQKKIAQKKKAEREKLLAKLKKQKKQQEKNKRLAKNEIKRNEISKKEMQPKKLKDVVAFTNRNEMSIDAAAQPIYIGQMELEALQMQEAIEQEIVQHWRPPAGLSKYLTCTMKILVGCDGMIKKVEIVKASGVLMYDISVRTAVAHLHLPKVAWGKELNITFNQ